MLRERDVESADQFAGTTEVRAPGEQQEATGDLMFLIDMLERGYINGTIYAYKELKELGYSERDVIEMLKELGKSTQA